MNNVNSESQSCFSLNNENQVEKESQLDLDSLTYESWERQKGETSLAFSAFCSFRDYGPERNIKKALLRVEQDEAGANRKYRTWRNWAVLYHWNKRAADYDRYTEKLKQTEIRKTIEAQGEMHRAVTGKMLDVVKKKLDLMNPADLSQGTVTEWVQTAIRAEREAAGLVAPNGKAEPKQGELNFVSDFNGL